MALAFSGYLTWPSLPAPSIARERSQHPTPATTTFNHDLMKLAERHAKLDILCCCPFGKQLVKETQKRKKRKWKWRCSRGPHFLPEVSSAPSWFEFCSFLLTLAAGADMISPLTKNNFTENYWLFFLNFVKTSNLPLHWNVSRSSTYCEETQIHAHARSQLYC